MRVEWQGTVFTGLGQAGERHVWPDGWQRGTLNLAPLFWPLRGWLPHLPPDEWHRDKLDLRLGEPWPVIAPALMVAPIEGPVLAIVGPHDFVEVAARRHLRSAWDLNDGDIVRLIVPIAEPISWQRWMDRRHGR